MLDSDLRKGVIETPPHPCRRGPPTFAGGLTKRDGTPLEEEDHVGGTVRIPQSITAKLEPKAPKKPISRDGGKF